MSEAQTEEFEKWAEDNQAKGLPDVTLPSGTVTIIKQEQAAQ